MNENTIRIKDMEGDAAQLTDFCKNNGFNLNDYLNDKPTKKHVPLWILTLVTFIFLGTSFILWTLPVPTELFKFLVLTTLLLMGCVLVILQHNYDKWPMTGIAAMTLLCVVLISLNVYTPKQVLKKVEDQAIKKISK